MGCGHSVVHHHLSKHHHRNSNYETKSEDESSPKEIGKGSQFNNNSISDKNGSFLSRYHNPGERSIIQEKQEISSSQVNFFKMLDEKIEKGTAIDEKDEDIDRLSINSDRFEKDDGRPIELPIREHSADVHSIENKESDTTS